LASLLEAPLNAFSIANTAVCIVIDLSIPGNVIDSLLYWLNVIREHTQKALEEISKVHP
jgi:hypothetical protein